MSLRVDQPEQPECLFGVSLSSDSEEIAAPVCVCVCAGSRGAMVLVDAGDARAAGCRAPCSLSRRRDKELESPLQC